MDKYTINNIVLYRKLDWKLSQDFFYLTDIPEVFEPFAMYPNFYSYGILTKGFMKIEIDNCLYHITPQSFMIYRPEQTLKIVEIKPGTQGAFILFTRRFIQKFQPAFDTFFSDTFLDKYFGSHITIDQQDHDQLSLMFDKIFDLLSSIYTERWEISANNLISALINETDIILKKYKSAPHAVSIREMSIINEFKALAKEHFITKRQIDFYTGRLHISNSSLYKIFKKYKETTPSSYLNDLLIEEAKFMLVYSENNISEIADQLSFSDIHAFSKYFKKHTSFPPTVYRTTFAN
ncbi:MAG TPA: helix-turn-helix transcriptional regulator [Flavipsychrobacter sp.]|nr:helix-turn-helix transcriptional regulator [Flavipsychrobacter sp.]